MNLATISGPPSSGGRPRIILKVIDALKQRNISVGGVVKFDCLYTDDDILYEKAGVPVKKKDCQVLYVQIISLYPI